MKRNILVVAAHPDDETLGCGGTIARHADFGDDIFVLFMTDGVGARNAGGEVSRWECAEKATSILGTSILQGHDFPDNEMDTVPFLSVVKRVEEVVRVFNPDIVYTHHSGDLNIDHRITCQAVMTACRPLPDSAVEAIYGFEVCSSTEWGEPFTPNYYVSLAKSHYESKMEALSAYGDEILDFPHARSKKAVAAQTRIRGCQVGVRRAEAFVVLRQVSR